MSLNLFGIKELEDPYCFTGTADKPGEKRTIESIATALVGKFGFSGNIVVQVLFLTFYDMTHRGLEFKGNGEYASEGREMFFYIRDECQKLVNKNASIGMAAEKIDPVICTEMQCKLRSKSLVKLNRVQKVKKATLWPRMSFPNYIFSVGFAVSIVEFKDVIWHFIMGLIQ